MSFFKKNKGSMVVEAALVLPIFLSFLLLLIMMIKISIVEIELTNAVSEATKQVSTHMYPVGLLYDKFSETEIGEATEITIDTINDSIDKLQKTKNFLAEYSFLLPNEAKNLLAISDRFEKGIEETYDNTLSVIFQPIVDYYVDDSIIKLENFQVTKVVLPDLIHGEQPYFGIEVRYDMRLNVPFFDRLITFKKQAYERVWLGEDLSFTKTISDSEQGDNQDEQDVIDESPDDDQETMLIIDSISSPVQRGHKVRIIAEGPSNRTATIKIMYQSGFIKEIKGTFNNQGVLIADIQIGGHSNEGIYQAIITVDNMEASADFEVLSKDSMESYVIDRKDKAGK
ncbi:MAG: hypothetical protein AB7V16_05730 [Vulcanibacillus sp.]